MKNEVHISGGKFDLEPCPLATSVPNEDLTLRAKLVIELLRCGCIAGINSGEDSQGRAKLSLQNPLELVDRTFEIVDLAFIEFSKRDWLVSLPTLEEMEGQIDRKVSETWRQ